jgi:hypothetical protein
MCETPHESNNSHYDYIGQLQKSKLVVKYLLMAPFPEAIRQKEVAKTEFCEICGEFLPADGYSEIHSATGLHLVVVNKGKGACYEITDPPSNLETLKGERVGLYIYPYKSGQISDGVKLCFACHEEIHRVALLEAKRLNPGFTGNSAPPLVLKDVTLFFLKRKRF